MNVLLRIFMPGLATVLLIGCNGEPSLEEKIANYYVTKQGSPAPLGSSDKPYHVVQSATERARIYYEHDNEYKFNILIGPGKYYETFTINTPVVLKASSGVVTIGKLDYEKMIDFKVLTLNTHLFAGSAVGTQDWKDVERSEDIAGHIYSMEPKSDIVSFQEIWNSNMFKNGDRGIQPLLSSIYPYGKAGNSLFPNGITFPVNLSHSGLAVMSRTSFNDFIQREYSAEYGNFESLSAKGWIQITTVKGNFTITIFNTHTQADYTEDDIAARWLQIFQLSNAILLHRILHPDHIVFAMGDFNVYGEFNEYNNTLIPLMGHYGGGDILTGITTVGYDADRNNPGFMLYSEDTYTFCTCNNATCCNILAHYFDDESSDGRLDYIFYYPSMDGLTEVLPTSVNVEKFRGRALSEDGITTDESSDHWGVYGQFKLIRIRS